MVLYHAPPGPLPLWSNLLYQRLLLDGWNVKRCHIMPPPYGLFPNHILVIRTHPCEGPGQRLCDLRVGLHRLTKGKSGWNRILCGPVGPPSAPGHHQLLEALLCQPGRLGLGLGPELCSCLHGQDFSQAIAQSCVAIPHQHSTC